MMKTQKQKKHTGRTLLLIFLGLLLIFGIVIGYRGLARKARVASSPAIQMVAPTATDTLVVATRADVKAVATQRGNQVNQVDLYVDGILAGSKIQVGDVVEASWAWTPLSAGEHELVVVASDVRGIRNFTRDVVEVSEVADVDMDGVPDVVDACPEEFGYATADGCAIEGDTDSDGLVGSEDVCPDEPGSPADMGCPHSLRPDGDRDGILDTVDLCPEEFGLVEFEGCPIEAWLRDRDGDRVPDFLDRCPDEAGPAATFGCPSTSAADRDGDGIMDSEDACPEESGAVGTTGCPLTADRDGDGIPDSADACPDEAGSADVDGCYTEESLTDSDGDRVPDFLDLMPLLPGLFRDFGLPIPNDADADGLADDEDNCPAIPGPSDNHGCPRLMLPLREIEIQNAFIPEIYTQSDGTETVISEMIQEFPNDADHDGVADDVDRCPGVDGEPYLNGCVPEDDQDRDGIPDHIDSCDDEPGFFWGETSTRIGCQNDNKITLEAEITGILISPGFMGGYCYIRPNSSNLVHRIPPDYSYYLIGRFGAEEFFKLSQYRPKGSANEQQSGSVEIILSCWAQPEEVGQPARYLGEIYRIHTLEDWDAQIRYAAGIGDDAKFEVYYRICRNRCP